MIGITAAFLVEPPAAENLLLSSPLLVVVLSLLLLLFALLIVVDDLLVLVVFVVVASSFVLVGFVCWFFFAAVVSNVVDCLIVCFVFVVCGCFVLIRQTGHFTMTLFADSTSDRSRHDDPSLFDAHSTNRSRQDDIFRSLLLLFRQVGNDIMTCSCAFNKSVTTRLPFLCHCTSLGTYNWLLGKAFRESISHTCKRPKRIIMTLSPLI